MSFMENQVLGYKSPLYGRRTSQFRIRPFDYLESAEKLPGFTNEEKITLYGICGGIPDYISRIDNGLSVEKNTENLFFNPSGRLFEEPSNLLKQELRSPQTYNAIITAIAFGATKLNEIASKAGIETSQCSNMLATLINLEIVKKEYPIVDFSGKTGAGVNGKPSRKTIYRLADFMFRFWYRFVLPELSRVSMGFGKTACADVFAKASSGGRLEAYTGPVFEECSSQFLWREMGRGKYSFTKLGRWCGANSVEKREEEIDILATDENKNALFGECKWKSTKTGTETLDDLTRRSGLFPCFNEKRFILFSKSGFTAELQKTAAGSKAILIGLKEMF